MTRYLSTRGYRAGQRFSDILLGGLAPDGGLYMPEEYPQVTADELTEWRQLPYHALALRVLEKFIGDIPACDLKGIVDRSYTEGNFRWCRPGPDGESRAAEITPLTTLETDFHLLELSNGPTLAFKDMAMQLLGNLFEYVLDRRREEINILGATSGDTGSAAEYAMRGKKGIRVFMLSPLGKMSPFQTAQMYSLQDANIFNLAVTAPFDAVIVPCAPEREPAALLAQLKDGGRMIVPLGVYGDQELYRVERHGPRVERLRLLSVRFVPMTGDKSAEIIN